MLHLISILDYVPVLKLLERIKVWMVFSQARRLVRKTNSIIVSIEKEKVNYFRYISKILKHVEYTELLIPTLDADHILTLVDCKISLQITQIWRDSQVTSDSEEVHSNFKPSWGNWVVISNPIDVNTDKTVTKAYSESLSGVLIIEIKYENDDWLC